MNLDFHRLTVNQFDRDNKGRMKILLDGKEILCRSYKIEQSYDTVPSVELELVGYGAFDGEVDIDADNDGVDFLCRHMTLGQLKRIIAWWNFYHDANCKLVGSTVKECAETTKNEKNV